MAAAEAVEEQAAVEQGAENEPENADDAGRAGEEGDEDEDGLGDMEKQDKDSDKGNKEYAEGKYEDAVKSWERSLKSVNYIVEKGYYKDREEQMQEIHQMELRLCLNIAQGYMKLKDWREAINYADKALARDGTNAKALYRKASSLMQLSTYPEAVAVLEQLLQSEPQNAAAKQLLAEARRTDEMSKRKAKKVSQKMLRLLGSERDPRVPLTAREEFFRDFMELITWVVYLPFEVLELIRSAPARCREQWASLLAAARGRWLAVAGRARVHLQAAGLLRPRGGSKGASGSADAPRKDAKDD